ncbi:CUB and sushi domain-containing 3 [Olea europaea subsp. europaea]|nr:CUB and sushi domain-containing 3 [Olea europaea subsp. europaea]
MGLGNAGALLILVAISLFGIGMANKNFSAGWNGNWNHTAGWPYGHLNANQTSNRIIVGGSENWHFGFNYTDWAIRNGPFYLNDTLVFKFDPPNDTTFPHSVYLLPNLWSFQNCDLRRAKKIAQATQGGGEGFEFVLKTWQPYYFACGERNGFHCKTGMMKFVVWPLFRWY